MFGYVTANPKALSENDLQTYRGFYCGLCRSLGQKYGQLSRMALTYDMTFLALLLAALYEIPVIKGNLRCVPHPLKVHPFLSSEYTDYAADMSISLTYYNLMDNWTDNHSRADYLLACRLQDAKNEVAQKYPRQCAAIHACLDQLSRYEKLNSQDLDTVSGCFGMLLSEILDKNSDVWSYDLRLLGFYLGKFIYLMDAYEDLSDDLKRSRYNPLSQISKNSDFETKIHDILEAQIAEASLAFERLPILNNQDILRNILYSGVWTRYNELQIKSQKKGSR